MQVAIRSEFSQMQDLIKKKACSAIKDVDQKKDFLNIVSLYTELPDQLQYDPVATEAILAVYRNQQDQMDFVGLKTEYNLDEFSDVEN